MKALLSKKEWKRMSENLQSITHTCNCGHRVTIYHPKEKEICTYCGSYVFKNKKVEFKYRMKEKLK